MASNPADTQANTGKRSTTAPLSHRACLSTVGSVSFATGTVISSPAETSADARRRWNRANVRQRACLSAVCRASIATRTVTCLASSRASTIWRSGIGRAGRSFDIYKTRS